MYEEQPAQGVPRDYEKTSKWTHQDNIGLVNTLVEQRDAGQGHGVIWTPEAWEAVAEALKGSELVSGGAQKTVRQCKARWQQMKIEYRIVKFLRQQPGFSWDERNCLVTASPQDWDRMIAEHKETQPWRRKPFPAYERCRLLIDDDVDREEHERLWKERSSIPIYGEGDDRGASADQDREGGQANGHAPGSRSANAVAGPSRRRPPRTSRASQAQSQVQPQQPQQQPHPPMQDPSANAAPPQVHQPELFTHTALASPSTAAPQQYNYMAMTPQYPAPPPPPHTFSQPHAYPGSYVYPSVSTSISTPGPMTPQQSAPPPPPPTRLAQAIQALQSTESLDEGSLARVARVFAFRPDCADAYLALNGEGARSHFVRELLEEDGRGSAGIHDRD